MTEWNPGDMGLCMRTEDWAMEGAEPIPVGAVRQVTSYTCITGYDPESGVRVDGEYLTFSGEDPDTGYPVANWFKIAPLTYWEVQSETSRLTVEAYAMDLMRRGCRVYFIEAMKPPRSNV